MPSTEQTIKDAIITKLNADATTKDEKTDPLTTTKIRQWEQMRPPNLNEIRYPYGYVSFAGQSEERADIKNYDYDFVFEIGVIQRNQKELTAENFVLDLLGKVENVIKADWTLSGNTKNLSKSITRTVINTGDNAISYIVINTKFRKSKVARI